MGKKNSKERKPNYPTSNEGSHYRVWVFNKSGEALRVRIHEERIDVVQEASKYINRN